MAKPPQNQYTKRVTWLFCACGQRITPGARRERSMHCTRCLYRQFGRLTPSRDRTHHRFQMQSWRRAHRLESCAL